MRIRALTVRILRQFVRDKRTMALLIIAPLLVLSLMYLVFHSDDYKPKLGQTGLPEAFKQQFGRQAAQLYSYPDREDAEAALQNQEIDAYFAMDGARLLVRLEGSDPAINRAVMMLIAEAKATTGSAAPVAAPVVEYLHGSAGMTMFDGLGPILIGLFSFFFVFLIAGVSFLKERTSGTLERLLATPLRRSEIVAGYILGFGLFTGIQSVLMALFSIHVLGLMMAGSIWLVLLVTLLLSITALSLGTFLSAFANTEFQMIQFIPLVIVPQVFFSGLFDLEAMSPWLRWLSNLMPLKYGADALRNIMIRGEGWDGIALDVAVLIGLSLLFMAANVLALRKHRKI